MSGLVELKDIFGEFWGTYQKSTPSRLKVLDAFLVFQVLTGVMQFVYVVLVGTFPFNSFLAGFISCVGSFILTVALRMHANPTNTFTVGISTERAFADYIFANLVLHLAVLNLMG